MPRVLSLPLAVLLTAAVPAVALAALGGDNGRILFSSDGELWPDASRPTATPEQETQTTWSPDGARIAFERGPAENDAGNVRRERPRAR